MTALKWTHPAVLILPWILLSVRALAKKSGPASRHGRDVGTETAWK